MFARLLVPNAVLPRPLIADPLVPRPQAAPGDALDEERLRVPPGALTPCTVSWRFTVPYPLCAHQAAPGDALDEELGVAVEFEEEEDDEEDQEADEVGGVAGACVFRWSSGCEYGGCGGGGGGKEEVQETDGVG